MMANQSNQIYDWAGRPIDSVGFSTYRPIESVLRHERWLNGVNKGNLPTEQALPMHDRRKVIAWLREKCATGIMATIVYRFALGIGHPKPRVNTRDVDFNDAKETFLEEKLNRIGWGSYDNLEAFLLRKNIEKAICGEAYLVKMRNGKMRLIPAELIGSPKEGKPENEIDGVVYGRQGQPVRYRIGKRTERGKISYEPSDATLVDADFVYHDRDSRRAEELRPFPPLAASIKDIYDLTQISDAKVESIKIAAAYAMFIKKNIDPAVFQAIMTEGTQPAQLGAEQATFARSKIAEIGSVLYGEVGESADVIQPSIQAQDFDLFFFGLIGRICGPLGMPAEEAISGYWRSNYSSSRADKLRWRQAIERNRRMDNIWLNEYQGWQTNRARIQREFALEDPEGSTGRTIEWQWPAVPEIDSVKSATAAIALHSAGLSSMSESAGERGRYAGEVTREKVNEAYDLILQIKQKVGDQTGVSADEILAVMPKGDAAASVLSALQNVEKVDAESSR
ncbi:MAG: phage portal protein [Verrucomicrobiota bacterium]